MEEQKRHQAQNSKLDNTSETYTKQKPEKRLSEQESKGRPRTEIMASRLDIYIFCKVIDEATTKEEVRMAFEK